MPSHHCPNCEREIRYRDEHAGRVVKCPQCGDSLRLPALAAEPAVPSGAPPSDTLRSLRRQVLGLWCALAAVTLLASSALIVAARTPAPIVMPAVTEGQLVEVKAPAAPAQGIEAESPVPRAIPRVSIGSVERFDEVEARVIRVVDDQGRARITMTTIDDGPIEGAAALMLFDRDQSTRIAMFANHESAELSLHRGEGLAAPYAIQIAGTKEMSVMRVHGNESTKPRILLGVTPAEGVEGDSVMLLFTDPKGDPTRVIQ